MPDGGALNTVTLSDGDRGVRAAVGLLAAGNLVAFPTETVYGLGADARCARAVAGVYAAKGRPSFNPLIVHVADRPAAQALAKIFPATGTYTQYAKLSSIPETPGVPEATDMIRLLVEGQEAVVRTARALMPQVDAAGDEPSADLLNQRMQVHEKTAWMLRSLLET